MQRSHITNNMRRNRIISATVSIFCSVLSLHALTSQNNNRLPAWETDKSWLNQLGSAENVEEFQFNPPKGYILQTKMGPYGSKAMVWIGPARSDGTRPQIMIFTVTPPPEEMKKPEQTLNILLERISNGRKDWQRTRTEQGLVNGLRFVRARWSGINIPTGHKMHGFTYVTVVNGKVLQLLSQDVEPYHKEALQLAESSAFTFKKR